MQRYLAAIVFALAVIAVTSHGHAGDGAPVASLRHLSCTLPAQPDVGTSAATPQALPQSRAPICAERDRAPASCKISGFPKSTGSALNQPDFKWRARLANLME